MELPGVTRLFGCLRLTVQVFGALDGEVAACLYVFVLLFAHMFQLLLSNIGICS